MIHPTPINLIHLACEYLPELWDIEFHAERGALSIHLFNEHGDEIHLDDSPDDSAEFMTIARINHARTEEGMSPLLVPD